MKINKALIDPWPKYVPLRFSGCEKALLINDLFDTHCQNKKSCRLKIEKEIENTNSRSINSARPTDQHGHVKVLHQDRRTQNSAQSYPVARQDSRTEPPP